MRGKDQSEKQDKRSSFLRGTFILSAAGITSKVIGAGAKVALIRFILGAEGIGLYQMAYPIYTIILTVSRAGIPVSISKLVAGKTAKGQHRQVVSIFKVSLILSVLLGISLGLILMFGASPISHLLGDPRSFYPIVALSPAVLIVSLMAAFRGFFQGQNNMVPTAASQVTEQIFRVLTMLTLGYFLLPLGVELAAAGATLGAFLGGLAGLVVLVAIYVRGQKKGGYFKGSLRAEPLGWEEFMLRSREIFDLALPVSFGALVLPLMRSVDAAIVPRRLLSAGLELSQATALFGHFAGMAMVLVDFPAIITVALAATLVPAVSEAFAEKDYSAVRMRTTKALRFTNYIGLPSAFGLAVLAEPISRMLFGEPGAAIPLRIVAFGVIFIGLHQTSSGILQGLGRTRIPAYNLLYGAVLNAILNFILTGIPGIHIRGAALGTLLGFGLASLLNLRALNRLIDLTVDIQRLLFKPMFAVMIMILSLRLSYYSIDLLTGSNSLATLASVGTGIVVYGWVMILIGTIGREELLLIPRVGAILARWFEKVGLLRR